MRSVNKLFCVLGVVAVAFLGLTAGTGCSDKPESKAARDLNKSTQQALEAAKQVSIDADSAEDDPLDKAQSSLSSAISKNRSAKNAVSSATMAQGDLIFAKAQKLHAALPQYMAPLTDAANKIASFNKRAIDLADQQISLQDIVDVNEEQIKKTKELLAGSINVEGFKIKGLKPQLKTLGGQLAGFQTKLKGLDSKRSQAIAAANDFQRQADLKLRQAEAAQGQQKVELSTAGLDLTSKSNEKQILAQSIFNEMEIVDSKIAVVKPLVEKLTGEIEVARKSLAGLQNSSDMAKLKSQLAEVSRQLEKTQSDMSSGVKAFNNAKAEYSQKAKDIIDVLESALESYGKVSSSSLRKLASEKTAISNSQIASVCVDQVSMLQYSKAMIESIRIAVEGSMASQLDKLINAVSDEAGKYGEMAFEKFDAAAEKYTSLSGGGDYGCTITKRHILACHAKMMLAEKLEEYDISDKAAETLEALLVTVQECDPDFSKTLAAKLIEGDIDFTPMLAVDNTEYYEGIRQQFQSHGWPKLPVDQREAAVTQLLEEFAVLEAEGTFDRETYESILGPEKARLIKAIEDGFAEEEDSYGNDPNSF